MKSLQAVLLILIIMVSSGCYHGIIGKVVDNTTGKPLEDALVVVQWTRPDIHSIEGWSIEVIKNYEVLTDKDGVFTIKDTPMNPFANPPRMIIYKEGYIPWQNDAIFPSGNKVKDSEWINNMTYKLDVFTDKYTTNQLDNFMSSSIIGPDPHETPLFNDIRDKISRRRQAESDAQQKNKWLIEIKKIFESLDKGPHTWVNVRDKLTDKNYEMDWMLKEANKENSAVSIAMKNNGVTLVNKELDSDGHVLPLDMRIVFNKK